MKRSQNKNNMIFGAAQYTTGNMISEDDLSPKPKTTGEEINRDAFVLIPEGFEKRPTSYQHYYIHRRKINRDAYEWVLLRGNKVIAVSKIYGKQTITNQALKICKELDIRFNKSIIGDRRQPIIMKGAHRMTWKEFKDKVEEAGITDETKISWVDWVEGTEIQAHLPTEDEDAYIG